MKAVEAIFNQEKALVVPFSVITNLVDLRLKLYLHHRARRYPGQLPPPHPALQPRRPALPPAPALAEEWRRIGSRRSEFLHLGLPITRAGSVNSIVVKPAENNSIDGGEL